MYVMSGCRVEWWGHALCTHSCSLAHRPLPGPALWRVIGSASLVSAMPRWDQGTQVRLAGPGRVTQKVVARWELSCVHRR